MRANGFISYGVNKGFFSDLVNENPATDSCGVFVLSCVITGLLFPELKSHYEYR